MAFPYNPTEAVCDFSKNQYGLKKIAFALKAGLVSSNTKEYSVMTKEQAENSSKPFDVFEPWSRVHVSIDETPKGGVKKTAYFKMTIGDLRLLKRKAEAKFIAPTVVRAAPANVFVESKFPSGEFLGKTPSEALKIEGARKKLIANLVFLEEHQESESRRMLYKSIINALYNNDVPSATTEAVAQDATVKSGIESLWGIQYRSTSEKNDAGKTKFYDASVLYDASRSYPITIKCSNYWATLVIREDKTQSPGKDREVIAECSFSMTLDSFWEKLDHLCTVIDGLYTAQAHKAQKCVSDLLLEKSRENGSAEENQAGYVNYPG